MTSHITIKLFATLKQFTPVSSESYPIRPGISVRELLDQLGVFEDQVKLVFINGAKHDLTATLNGGERVGIVPAVGGG